MKSTKSPCAWSAKITPLTAALFVIKQMRTSNSLEQLRTSRELVCPFFVDRYKGELPSERFAQLCKRIARCYESRFRLLTALENAQTQFTQP